MANLSTTSGSTSSPESSIEQGKKKIFSSKSKRLIAAISLALGVSFGGYSMDNDDFKDEIALAFAKSPDTAHDLDNIDNDTFKAEEALALEKGRDTTQVLPKFFDKEVGISPDEQAAIEEFADKIKNDPVLRTKLGIEFQRKPDYAVLKEDFLHPVEMQFGFQLLLMDDYASMEEKDAMYATYAKLIGAVLSEENIKPLSELERVAENNMGKFLETYNVQGLDMEEKKRRLHQSYMIVGKYAMKLQYIDRQGNHDGARALRLTDSIASKLQKVSKNIRKKATSDDVVVPEGAEMEENGEFTKTEDLVKNGELSDVAGNAIRYRFIRLLKDFSDIVHNSVDETSVYRRSGSLTDKIADKGLVAQDTIATDSINPLAKEVPELAQGTTTLKEKEEALSHLLQQIFYIGDISQYTVDTSTKTVDISPSLKKKDAAGQEQANEYLRHVLLDFLKQDEVIDYPKLSDLIQSIVDDVNYANHVFGRAVKPEDHASILSMVGLVAKGKNGSDRMQFLTWEDETSKLISLDGNSTALINQLGKYHQAANLDLSGLAYMDTSAAEQLVTSLNQSDKIESVTLNLKLIKDSVGDENLKAILTILSQLEKKMVLWIGDTGLGYTDDGPNGAHHHPLLESLLEDTKIPGIEVRATELGSEFDLLIFKNYKGDLSFTILIDNPLDSDSTEEFLIGWLAAQGDDPATLKLGMYKLNNVFARVLDDHAKSNHTVIFSNVERLQGDFQDIIAYSTAGLSFPSLVRVNDALLSAGNPNKTQVDIEDIKKKKKPSKGTLSKIADGYDLSGVVLTEDQAYKMSSEFHGAGVVLNGACGDEILSIIAQSPHLVKMGIKGTLPSVDTLEELSEHYINTIDLSDVDLGSISSDHRDALSKFDQVTITSDSELKLSTDQWKDILGTDSKVIINAPIILHAKDMAEAIDAKGLSIQSLGLVNRSSIIIVDKDGKDVTLDLDTYYEYRDSYRRLADESKKDDLSFDLVDLFTLFDKLDIDFANGNHQYPAILYNIFQDQK